MFLIVSQSIYTTSSINYDASISRLKLCLGARMGSNSLDGEDICIDRVFGIYMSFEILKSVFDSDRPRRAFICIVFICASTYSMPVYMYMRAQLQRSTFGIGCMFIDSCTSHARARKNLGLEIGWVVK
jgi:hypothetical protein